jgi:hypothetical protein
MPTSRSIMSTDGNAPMRLCARPVGDVDRIDAAAFNARHCSSIGRIHSLGRHNFDARHEPARHLRAPFDLSASGTGVTPAAAYLGA